MGCGTGSGLTAINNLGQVRGMGMGDGEEWVGGEWCGWEVVPDGGSSGVQQRRGICFVGQRLELLGENSCGVRWNVSPRLEL